MSSDDDYLWEKKGEGSASTQQLERVLGQARFSSMTTAPAGRRPPWRMLTGIALVAAAMVALMVWPRRDTVRLQTAEGVRSLNVDEWLETSSGESVTLALAREMGAVEVHGDSKVRLKRVDRTQQRLELAKGSLHAVVMAPPRLFVVDVPNATAVDLGCEYTLDVLPSGASRLHVRSGQVELDGNGAGSPVTVYAGMWSQTRLGRAPQVAIADGATLAFLSAAMRLESEPEVLPLLLSQASPRDAVTLFQLMARVEEPVRAQLRQRLSELVPSPGTDEGWLESCLRARQ